MASKSQYFETTIMSVIQGTASSRSANAREYVERFYDHYSAPIRQYLCRACRLDDAAVDDVLQQFLVEKLLCEDQERNLAHRYLTKRSEGADIRFRAYLLRSLRNFVRDTLRQKKLDAVSLDCATESEYSASEEDLFSRRWASNLLKEALAMVQQECQKLPEQESVWSVLEARVVKPALLGVAAEPYETLTARLQFDSPKQASNRLQTALRKMRSALQKLVAVYLPVDSETAAQEIEEEIAELIRVAAHCEASETEAAFPELCAGSQDSVALLEGVNTSADMLWSDSDFAAMWLHLTRARLSEILPFEHTLPGESTEFDRELPEESPLLCFDDLLHDPKPDLELLRSLKDYAKQQSPSKESSRSQCNGLPKPINAVLYLSAVGCAWLCHGVNLSSDSMQRFVPRVRTALKFDWLDEQTRLLLRGWLNSLEE